MTTRKEIAFLNHVSESVFETLIVSGAPATGLLYETTTTTTTHKHANQLQKTLTLLRGMWQRADTLFVPRSDLEQLHSMECKTVGQQGASIPDRLAQDHRKLARYYVFLLFRYCVSALTETPATARSLRDRVFQRKEPRKPLSDIPLSWLDNRACVNNPSAPPLEYAPYRASPHAPGPGPVMTDNRSRMLHTQPETKLYPNLSGGYVNVRREAFNGGYDSHCESD